MSAAVPVELYAVVGKPFAKVRIDGRKVTVAKRAHVIRNGRTVCKVENAFRRRKPTYTYVVPGKQHPACRLCLAQSGAAQFVTTTREPIEFPHKTDGHVNTSPSPSVAGVEPNDLEFAEPLLSVLLGERIV
jgi:hypothetical protein